MSNTLLEISWRLSRPMDPFRPLELGSLKSAYLFLRFGTPCNAVFFFVKHPGWIIRHRKRHQRCLPRFGAGVSGNGWRNERHLLLKWCWITFMNSWTLMNHREPWVVACNSKSKILVVYLSVTVTLQQYTMIEHLIATEKSNCSLKRLFIEIGHFACTCVIRKKLGVCDVKHLKKLKAPPWQNTQLPFGAPRDVIRVT